MDSTEVEVLLISLRLPLAAYSLADFSLINAFIVDVKFIKIFCVEIK